MIPGTSKILSKSGPGDLLTITKMLQKIQEKYGIILKKYYFFISQLSGTSKISQIWTHQTPIFFDYFWDPTPTNIGISERFQSFLDVAWNLGIVGQLFFENI